MNYPRGFLLGTVVVVALSWGLWAADPHSFPGIVSPIAIASVCVANLVVTVRSRRVKQLIVRAIQRWILNPPIRLLLRVGIMPLGYALLETRGRKSGLPRQTPVGSGRMGDEFWIIAELGEQAGYVRNIRRDPEVRVRLRVGYRFAWVPGVAEVVDGDDVLARQLWIIAWHPLRMLNAVNVRVLGTDLVSVRIRLWPSQSLRTPERFAVGIDVPQ